MEPLAVILMIGLFILVLVFIFSTALLTPLIGKKNLIFVIALGFTVGAVGGAFFIAPVFDDIPDMARSVYMVTTTGTDVIGLNVSTDLNVTNFIENTKKIDGVQSVQSDGITLKTSYISDDWKSTFLNRIPEINENITSVQIPANDTMIIQVKNNTDPQEVINNLEKWMLYVSGGTIRYSIVRVTLNVDAPKLDKVISQIPQGDVIITDVNGPTEKNVQALKDILPNKSNVVLFCGFLGMITGLAGLFIDSIVNVFNGIRERIIKLKK
ncbi:hypothetical protein [Methanobacterium sp. SMA-27]|uniref:hypothetical protein n=1 Tax=Methanobacterium sp. SMA-27 TaxID=1495336 RepID=UPI00064F5729|nr:hypothetical protein [Methanobacterium sp. SMA-27]